MSSQFSYELDERQIRIQLQDAELDYNDDLWNKFESMATVESKSIMGGISHFVPSINLSISRSIIVPVLFIILIGGLSALLFSFVDFKKKEAIDKETPLVANPNNFKKAETLIQKTKKPTDKKAAEVPIIASLKKDSIHKTVVTSQTLIPEIKKEAPITAKEEKPKESIITSTEPKTETPHKTEKKRKKRKVKSEILPTINTTTILNEGVNEPELDLK